MTEVYPSQSQQTKSSTTATTMPVNSAVGLSAAAMEWLEARAIEPEVAIRHGWKTSEKSTSGEWIEIPYTIGGEVVNRKYRCITEKKFMQDKDGEKCLYNQDSMIGAERLVITEGEFDCIIAEQAGFVAVSIPIGATADYSWVSIPRSVKEVVICADNDAAGKKLLAALLQICGRPRCKIVKYPSGCKDLNDIAISRGIEEVTRAISEAKWCNASGLFSFSDLPPSPPVMSYSLGLPMLECNIRQGEFSVITGYPSVGKTTILNMLARNVIQQYGIRVCFASFEQKPVIQFPRLVSAFNRGEKSRTDKSRSEINDKIKIITARSLSGTEGEHEQTTVGWMLEQMAAACRRYDVQWFIVDPWNELEHSYPSGMSMTQYVGQAIMEIKRFAAEYGVHITVVAHPSKPPHEMAHKKPTLHNIADSQHWYNKPDLGIVLARHKLENGTFINEVDIQKSRYEDEIGKVGNQFYEIAFGSQSLIPAGTDAIDEIKGKKNKF